MFNNVELLAFVATTELRIYIGICSVRSIPILQSHPIRFLYTQFTIAYLDADNNHHKKQRAYLVLELNMLICNYTQS